MTTRKIGLALGLTALGATSALAQQDFTSRFAPVSDAKSSDYIVTLNANGVVQPSFPGSDRSSVSFFPSLSYRKVGEPVRFSAPDDGISISIIDNPTFRIGPVFRFQSGRYYTDDKLLYGLRKKNYDVESGVFIEYWPISFIRARAELRHGFRSDSGLVGHVGVDYVQPVGQFAFSVGPRLYFGDKRYADRWYGIRPDEAALNGFVTPYSPGGGVNAVGAMGAVTYKWDDSWSTTGYVSYKHLVGDVAKSPIVTKIGSKDQFTFGARVSYSFAFTPWW
ncbi:MipA/OmpV family protein [Enterovirga rhinocerotis]|uniref:Outer membrane scaffolding protein for murein synthesis (MipA/OmpV family) n=1 Tax=Enterovirga rhinocerotis TaxID=1339210 RepID=A0A4R7C791_9HYPH|nr:MipA/OmpV family protein [Enterovirga rhinocerotis]TDR94494.1 outer membrane scaffolding protein for murein synthesis (MipA/OmpV family) [Enterovirga rhinocerotis]